MAFLAGFLRKANRRVVAYEAFDGAIRVSAAPGSADWRVDEFRRDGHGYELRVVQFRRSMTPAPLLLIVRLWSTTDGSSPPAPDWQTIFQPLFRSFSVTVTPDGHEAIARGEGEEEGAPMCARERRTTHGRHQYTVAAVGPAHAFEERHAEIDRWFDSVTFQPE